MDVFALRSHWQDLRRENLLRLKPSIDALCLPQWWMHRTYHTNWRHSYYNYVNLFIQMRFFLSFSLFSASRLIFLLLKLLRSFRCNKVSFRFTSNTLIGSNFNTLFTYCFYFFYSECELLKWFQMRAYCFLKRYAFSRSYVRFFLFRLSIEKCEFYWAFISKRIH